MSDPILIVAPNLRTLPGLLLALARGRHVHVLEGGNGWPLLRPVWARAIRLLARTGQVRPVAALFDRSERYFVESWMPEHPNLFWDVEADLESRFALPRNARLDAPYGLAIRHAACTYAHHKLKQSALIEKISGRFGAAARIVGIDRAALDWYGVEFGTPACRVSPLPGPAPGQALLTALSVGLFALAWVWARLGRSAPAAAPVLLGTDLVKDDRHVDLVEEIGTGPADVLFIARNRSQQADAAKWPRTAGYRTAYYDDLAASLPEALRLSRDIVAGIWGLWRSHAGLPPELFFELAKLPLWQAKFRLLLARHPMKAFLAKDDYNSEHIIRTRELRRAGALSLGISHGMPTPGIVDPAVRYMDFDVYYSFGTYPYPDHYIGQTWSTQMRLKPIGSFGMRKDHLQRMGQRRPKDILFFISRLRGEEAMMGVAEELARAFPDRKVIVKPKYRPGGIYHVDFSQGMAPLPNLILSWDSSYDLMLGASYAVSNGASTVAAEAIQYGLATWVWDSFPAETRFFYRHFPGLCVTGAEQIIKGIRRIESGVETYDYGRFADLIDLSLAPVSDVIRTDLGLPVTQDKLVAAVR